MKNEEFKEIIQPFIEMWPKTFNDYGLKLMWQHLCHIPASDLKDCADKLMIGDRTPNIAMFFASLAPVSKYYAEQKIKEEIDKGKECQTCSNTGTMLMYDKKEFENGNHSAASYAFRCPYCKVADLKRLSYPVYDRSKMGMRFVSWHQIKGIEQNAMLTMDQKWEKTLRELDPPMRKLMQTIRDRVKKRRAEEEERVAKGGRPTAPNNFLFES